LNFNKILRHHYLNFFGRRRSIKPGIHILNSHFVTPFIHDYKIDNKIFDEFLNYLSKKTIFISLETATKKISVLDQNNDTPFISFTFDDGFEECYTVIAPLLEKYNTRGAFFINANYIDSNLDYQDRFNNRVKTKTKKPMSWNQVIDLHKRGHLIGSHGLDHINFASLSIDEIEIQLKKNKEILEEKLDYNCDYFAWTYGQLKHFSRDALDITEKYHSFIYSGTNYKNYFSYNGRVLNRRHQEAFWPLTHIKYFLSFSKIHNI
jgi:peptidoglycan/xylan/chitin deacetylase (PgdA/CDA1 family)